MSDTIDMYKDMKSLRSAERQAFGVPCPVCKEKLPKAQPKILQPGQHCRAHKPGYNDPRKRPTDAEFDAAMEAHGFSWRAGKAPEKETP